MNLAHAIMQLFPDANPMFDFRVVCDEECPDGRIEHWGIDAPMPTDAELSAAYAAYAATLYRDLRRAEYPSIGDQLDALFRAGAFPPDMAEAIQAVKNKYPKPA